ncbi:hypothetical protein D3C76_827510 [compost metagenome]
MVAGVLLTTEACVVPGVHHENPHSHEIGETVPPAITYWPALRPHFQPGRTVAVFTDGHRYYGNQTNQVERQQHAIELIQPGLHATEHQWHAV